MKKFVIIFAHYAAVFFVTCLIVTIAFSIYTPIFGEIQRPSYYLGFGLALTLLIVAPIFNKVENLLMRRVEKRIRNKLYKRTRVAVMYHENCSDDVVVKMKGFQGMTVGDLRAAKNRMEEQGWDS